MSNRWKALAVLFTVRTAMAFQFQSVAALSPMIMRDFGIGFADLGLLIGLYLSPGIFLALPGGKIGKKIGDKPAVIVGLVLMSCGGLVMSLSSMWEMQLGGRLLAGIGGVILNVLMSKMVTDWFEGREIATAMGIFVNSWPVGIALALVLLPVLADASSLSTATFFATGLAVTGLLLFVVFYRSPEPAEADSFSPESKLSGITLAAVIIAGSIWGLYNAALGMIFGFGPALLVERGLGNSEASSISGVALWLVAFSVPLGGFLADRTGRRNAVLVAGLVLFAIMLVVSARTEAGVMMFVVLGLVAGLSAGPIMSLPSVVLLAGSRAVGMGVFFTMFYLCVVLAPLVAGTLADVVGTARVTFDMGAAMLMMCCVALWVFERMAKKRL